jgi:hypothetical protein
MALVASIVSGICVVAGLSGTAMAAEQPKAGSSDSAGTDVSGGGDTTNVTSTSGSSTSTPTPKPSDSGSSSGSTASSGSGSSGGSDAGSSGGAKKPSKPATVKSKSPVVQKPGNKALVAPQIASTLSGASTWVDSNGDKRPSPGDIVTTVWKYTNNAADPTTAVTISATRGGAGACASQVVLGGGGKTDCTTTVPLKQSDIDAASISTVGTLTATIDGTPATLAATAKTTLHVVNTLQFGQRIFRLTDKDHDGKTSKGDLVEFVFTVKNTGNQTMTGLTIIDAKAASANVAITCSATTLAPRQTATCHSGGYTVLGSQAKAGVLTNTGQARVTLATGVHLFSAVSKLSIGVVKPPPPVKPHLALRMYVARIGTSGSATHVAAGDTISYGFVISNTGNTRISSLDITDQKLDAAKVAIRCNASSLSAGASTRCTSDPMTITAHAVNQQDLTNFASVRGRATNGVQVSAFDKITIGLSGNIHALVGSSGIRALPRTGGVDTTPITLGFWMVLIGLGLVVAGRRPGRPADAAISTERRSWISSRAVR